MRWHLLQTSVGLFGACLVAGCGPGIIEVTAGPTAPTEVAGRLVVGAAVSTSELTLTEAPRALTLVSGTAGVVTDHRVFFENDGALTEMPVGADGESMTLGDIRTAAPRGLSLWLGTSTGLFHEANRRLLRSPLSDTLAGNELVALSGYTQDGAEELWVITPAGLSYVAQGQLTPVQLAVSGHVAPAPSAVIAVGLGQAVVVVDHDAFFVDVPNSKAAWVAKGVGTVSALGRHEDGTALIASDLGLFVRNRLGQVEHVSFGAPVQDVTVTLGTTFIASQGSLAQLDAAGHVGTRLGAVAQPLAHGVAFDSRGNTFAIDGARLLKFATGTSTDPSFETDVKPFFAAHCMSCHATGDNGSPILALTTYATAKAKATTIAKRLQSQGGPPMPPESTEVLRPADYSVVLRWVASGQQP